MNLQSKFGSLLTIALSFFLFAAVSAQTKLNVAIAGLSHDHIYLIMSSYQKGEVNILGIAESNPVLIERFKKRYSLPDSLFYNNLQALLKKHKPDAVLAYNPIAEHLSVVETAAPLGISVMVEKPLAVTVKQADRIAALAKQYNIKVLTNYETTWYPSNQEVYQDIKKDNKYGSVRKMIVHDGHQGPKEIGVSSEFLGWLTDPEKNGGGALVDFGCYGANLMTWMMDGKAPKSVSAITHQIKPDVYPKVDDDATILLEYGDATGIIEASWNWPFSIKDFEVFGDKGYVQAVNDKTLRSRSNAGYNLYQAKPLQSANSSSLSYLSAVLSGQIDSSKDLSGLPNNLLVVKILEAAKLSAKTGKKVDIK
ncbi:Gfo/Idh/MocA family protein [Pedobacter sandarakinus]|uniref:Gfo/Idh/MocA family protein n=1 Tax=Pedobacter sandarakinus TaxID=353156 RepID=UPI002244FD87|nr:Gfo/Idh/MocA family oxidoreductase [Pedobacter sandarakinus]MCX2575186.1 Gfo/Idh/MocA family oxidoreductase [Pedobacter sandarakinus]